MKLQYFGALGAVILISALYVGCQQNPYGQQCVAPPATTNTIDSTNAFKIATSLNKLNVTNDLELNFTKLATQAYATLSDANTALLMLLNEVNCLLDGKQGNLPITQQMAQTLVQAAYKLALAKNGVAGEPSTTITATEKQALLKGAGADEVISKLKAFGYKEE